MPHKTAMLKREDGPRQSFHELCAKSSVEGPQPDFLFKVLAIPQLSYDRFCGCRTIISGVQSGCKILKARRFQRGTCLGKGGPDGSCRATSRDGSMSGDLTRHHRPWYWG